VEFAEVHGEPGARARVRATQRRGQCVDVADRRDLDRITRRDVARAVGIGRDHRRARVERLDDDATERLATRRAHEQVERLIPVLGVVTEAGEHDRQPVGELYEP
jgi:hypothetical protein